jgi:hypothetical protein
VLPVVAGGVDPVVAGGVLPVVAGGVDPVVAEEFGCANPNSGMSTKPKTINAILFFILFL